MDVPPDVPGADLIAKAVEDETLGSTSGTPFGPAASQSPAELVGTIQVLPLSPRDNTRYGPCRVIAYYPGDDILRLEWMGEIIWKSGEKKARWIGTRLANSLAFDVSFKDFQRHLPPKASVTKERVRGQVIMRSTMNTNTFNRCVKFNTRGT